MFYKREKRGETQGLTAATHRGKSQDEYYPHRVSGHAERNRALSGQTNGRQRYTNIVYNIKKVECLVDSDSNLFKNVQTASDVTIHSRCSKSG